MIQRIEDMSASIELIEEKVEALEVAFESEQEETIDFFNQILTGIIDLTSKVDAISELCVAAQVFDMDTFVQLSQEKLEMLYVNLSLKSNM